VTPVSAGPEDAAPAAAIILLTKNSQRYLAELLDAIFAQTTSRTFEVIAVDSGSRDDTLALLARYPVRVSAIAPADFNHGETRNYGARLASPSVRYLVYLTHDATPTPGWLDALLDAVDEAPTVAGAFSRHLPRPTCPLPMARLLQEEWEQSGTPHRVVKRLTDPADYARRRAYYAWFSNTSSCLRRSVWEQFPFERVDFAEDARWADQVLRAGYTLIYEPRSRVVHSHDYGLWDQFAQNVDHARGLKRALGDDVHGAPPPFTARLYVLARTLARDARFIFQQPLPLGRRLFWLAYAPLWHGASFLGSQVGQHYERLPAWLIRRISKQERLRAQGTGQPAA